ncbi:MAG: sulfatase-like hydrolase/transferase [Patescibacteria group bacterium]
MFKRKKLLYFSALVGALTIFNALFFFYYYTRINLQLSGLTVLFIFLFSLNFVLAFHLFKNKLWRISYALSFVLFTLYFLVNFAYYDVFRIFWQANTGQLGALNSSELDLLLSYYNLIPLGLYISAGALLILTGLSLFLYAKTRRRLYQKIVRSIDFLQGRRNSRSTPVWLIFFLIIVINTSAVGLLNVYKHQISLAGFQKTQYYSDLGPYGFLFDRLIVRLGQLPRLFAQPEATAKISDIDSLKSSLQKLAALSLNSEITPTPLRLTNKLDQPHIIIYQMESVGAWALKQEPSPMPFLSKLIAENISVGHFFSNSCTTINSELAANCSFYPESTGPVSDLFAYNNYYCLPEILKDEFDYTTAVYHANEASFWHRDILDPKWGYNRLYFTPDYRLRASDGEVLADVLIKIKQSPRPTFNYIIGFTSHGPHNQDFIDLNHYENNLNISPYLQPLSANSLSAATDEVSLRNYFGFLKAVDNDIKKLFSDLAANGLLDKTVVIIYGDHRYYPFASGDVAADFYNYNEIPFVMYVPGGVSGQAQSVASQADIAPTLLDIVAGEGYERPPYFIGTSLFSPDHPNNAISKCLGENDYIDDNIVIQNEKLLNTFQPLVFSQKYAGLKYEQYVAAFSEVIAKSDRILVNNELTGPSDSLTATSTGPAKELDLNQATDSDKDGLSDLREKALGLDPHNLDTDGDGYLDGVEVINGYNPKGPGKLAP